MLNGRSLVALGCVVTLAVMFGILGAVLLLDSLRSSSPPVVQQPVIVPTATSGYVESMKPISARIDVLNASGYPIAADTEGARAIAADSTVAQPMMDSGKAFFLTNGTAVQIINVDSPLARVQVMSGQHANRVGWLPVSATSTR